MHQLKLFFLFWIQIITAQKCGEVRGGPNLTGKIVGGYDVGYYKYSFYAALLLHGEPWCGGTLISKNTIVTAAHCYGDKLKKNLTLETLYTIKLGIYNKCEKEDTQREYKISKVIVHEKYLKFDPYFDVALVIINGNADGFIPACLPPKRLTDKTRGKEGIIIGLGTVSYGTNKYPCKLHEGRVLLYSDKICKNMIMKATDDKADYKFVNAFCAGYTEGGVDACQGDSGGPVLIIKDGVYVVLGVTSFGYDCAKKNLLGIYTDVSHFLDWIKRRSGVESSFAPTQRPQITDDPYNEQTYKPEQPFTGSTDFQVFPYTKPIYEKPPTVYVTVNDPNGINKWPPRRIIIEFKDKDGKTNDKTSQRVKRREKRQRKNGIKSRRRNEKQ